LFKDGKECVAVYGGSFDPPHFGHKAVVLEALKVLEIDTLIVLPTFLNPFKKGTHFSTEERLKMTKEIFKDFSNVLVSDFEIKEGKTTPTAKSLIYFQEEYEVKYLIIGADNLASIDKWYNFKWINEQITWVIATRRGYDVDTSKLRAFKILKIDADISSTEIRKNIVKDRSYMNMDERVERIVAFLDSKKAEEIESFDLENVDYLAKRVIIANSLGAKHSASLATQLKVELKPLGEDFLHVDESDDWVVIDLGDILIHIMTSEARQMYSLEDFLTELSSGKFASNQIT
jgi:nicotinate-nucleotide adenylyltransferase